MILELECGSIRADCVVAIVPIKKEEPKLPDHPYCVDVRYTFLGNPEHVFCHFRSENSRDRFAETLSKRWKAALGGHPAKESGDKSVTGTPVIQDADGWLLSLVLSYLVGWFGKYKPELERFFQSGTVIPETGIGTGRQHLCVHPAVNGWIERFLAKEGVRFPVNTGEVVKLITSREWFTHDTSGRLRLRFKDDVAKPLIIDVGLVDWVGLCKIQNSKPLAGFPPAIRLDEGRNILRVIQNSLK